MQRLNELLEKSRAAQTQATQKVARFQSYNRMLVISKFIKDNHVPKYLLFGVIMIKSVSVYDKMKQLVTINQMNVAIVTSRSKQLSKHFDSEEELADLMTKRMIEMKMVDGSDDGLDMTDEEYDQGLQGGILSSSAKVKTEQLR